MQILLEDTLELQFCPTGPGGGVDPTCSPNGPGGTPSTYRPPYRPPRVGQWPEVDRRKLRALQSRLSRAVGEPAKEVVRRQIEALRERVNAEARAAYNAQYPPITPAQQPSESAAQRAARLAQFNANVQAQQAAAAAKKADKTPKTKAELQTYLSNLTDPPEFVEKHAPLERAISLLSEDKRALFNSTMRKLFGEHIEPEHHIAHLMEAIGADKRIADRLTHASVNAGFSSFMGNYISMQLSGDDIHMHRSFFAKDDGTLYASNDYFKLSKSMQGDGTGVRAFSQQVNKLSTSGFVDLKTFAAKGGDLFGYKVWPKFGYSFEMPYRMQDAAEKAGVYQKAYRDVQGRYYSDSQATLQIKAGVDWWEKNGESAQMHFNLKGNSASHEILRQYRDKKIQSTQAQLSGLSFAFCPTGPGGGVDPTCSPHAASAGGGGYTNILEAEPDTPVLKKAKGTKNWPDEAKKKLRALQSKLSRAKTQAAKNIVIKAINAHIDAQNGVKATPAPAPTPAPAAPVNPGLAAYQASVAANAAAIAARDASIKRVDEKVHPLLTQEANDVEKWFVAANNNPNSPNKEAATSVRYYTGSGSAYINSALRGKTAITETQTKIVKQIDGAMEKFKTPVDLIVTRAVGPKTQKLWVEGHVHEEKAYSSCSATAVRHAGYNAGWDKETRCVISVPKGTPAMYIPKISAYPKERELLLGRGLKFKVTRREEKVPKDRMLKILYGSRAGVSTNDLRHKEYTLIHMEVVL